MEAFAATSEAMEALGRAAAETVGAGEVIALIGGLGAGKTHWTKGFVAGLGALTEVTSPTFTLVHEYRGGRLPVYHFDFYRLNSPAELLALGWDEIIESGGVVVAEWGDRFPELLPPNTRWLTISHAPEGGRTVCSAVR
jgi:tRNA threonylcarbamoyladenosine biosynthesis protein TsaE